MGNTPFGSGGGGGGAGNGLFGNIVASPMSSGGQAARKLELASRVTDPLAPATGDDGTTEEVEEADPLQKMIALQSFEGCWKFNDKLLKAVWLPEQHQVPEGVALNVWATILAITFLEKAMEDQTEAFEMVVEKARGWLDTQAGGDRKAVEEAWKRAKESIGGSNIR